MTDIFDFDNFDKRLILYILDLILVVVTGIRVFTDTSHAAFYLIPGVIGVICVGIIMAIDTHRELEAIKNHPKTMDFVPGNGNEPYPNISDEMKPLYDALKKKGLVMPPNVVHFISVNYPDMWSEGTVPPENGYYCVAILSKVDKKLSFFPMQYNDKWVDIGDLINSDSDIENIVAYSKLPTSEN